MAELVVLTGARAGAIFELPEMPTVIGRSPEAHFQLDDPWISSMHAMFERRGAELWVIDLESRNGTFVGAERVQEALLGPGAVLRFGRTQVRIERDASRPRDRAGPPPASAAARHRPRPTSRLDAPAITSPGITGPHGRVRAGAAAEALPFAVRPVALLRIEVHCSSSSPARPEVVRAAVDAAERAALAEGGLVARLPGGILALFGLAGPTPDDVDFALRAGRAAVREVELLGDGLSARAAVDAGPTLAGNLADAGAFELGVTGEPAARVERVLALAAAGEVLVGPGAAGGAGVEPSVKTALGAEAIEVGRLRREE